MSLPPELTRRLSKAKSGGEAFEEFFDYYERIVFSEENIHAFTKTLLSFPSPLRELAAAHQFWGMVSSDGPSCYYGQHHDPQLDDAVANGHRLLGLHSQATSILEVRPIADSRDEFTHDEESAIFRKVFVKDFEQRTGRYLLKECRKTPTSAGS